MFKKAKKGFTIVELVIVIAVIGILSAILIPTFANLTQQANDTALKSNLASAYSMYASEAADHEIAYKTSSAATVAEKQTGITFVAQQKAYLVPKTTDQSAASLQGYVFENDAWSIKLSDAKTKGTATGNIVLVVTAPAEQAVALSTFGDFVVYFIHD